MVQDIINEDQWFVEIIYKEANPNSRYQKNLIESFERICELSDYYFIEFSIIKRYIPEIRSKRPLAVGITLHVCWMGSILEIERAAKDFRDIVKKQINEKYVDRYSIYFGQDLNYFLDE